MGGERAASGPGLGPGGGSGPTVGRDYDDDIEKRWVNHEKIMIRIKYYHVGSYTDNEAVGCSLFGLSVQYMTCMKLQVAIVG